ncbi:MAG: hypothetical protein ACRCZP_17690 [Phycicoccus sp.]
MTRRTLTRRIGTAAELAAVDMATVRIINETPISFPVLCVEGLETSDRRRIRSGALDHRSLPLSVLAQVRNPDGGYGHDAAEIVGRLDTVERVPGPQVVSQETGRPFPEGTFVWRGQGVMDADHDAAQLVEHRFLRGNSVDLVGCEWDLIPPDDEDNDDDEDGFWLFGFTGWVEEITCGTIAATTLVSTPAFADGHVVTGSEFASRAGTAGLDEARARWAVEHAPAAAFRAVSFAARRRGDPDRVVRYAAPQNPPVAPPVSRWQLRSVRAGLPVVSVPGWDPVSAVADMRLACTRPDGTFDTESYARGFLHHDPAVTGPAGHATPVGAVVDGQLVIAREAVSQARAAAGPDAAAVDRVTDPGPAHEPSGVVHAGDLLDLAEQVSRLTGIVDSAVSRLGDAADRLERRDLAADLAG